MAGMLWDISEDRTFEEMCENYDAHNPEIWEMFKKFTFQAINAGRKYIGARMIIERIRWETMIRATSGDGFKINNMVQPYFARKFMRLYPQHKDIFRTRKCRLRDRKEF